MNDKLIIDTHAKKDVQTNDQVFETLQVEPLYKKHRRVGRESLNNDELAVLTSKESGEVVAFVSKAYLPHMSKALGLELFAGSKNEKDE